MPGGRVPLGGGDSGYRVEVIAVIVTAAELEAAVAELSASLPGEEVFKGWTSNNPEILPGRRGSGCANCHCEAGKVSLVVGGELPKVLVSARGLERNDGLRVIIVLGRVADTSLNTGEAWAQVHDLGGVARVWKFDEAC